MDKKKIYIDQVKRNESGAAFYKGKDSQEGFYHICDDIQVQYMPEIFNHDIKSVLYINNESLTIRYCPLCGKRL